MKRVVGKLEGGQSLVLISIFIVGFVAMLLLVLDGGNAYFNRRVAQTAADAGALAGARVYCEDENETAAVTAALDYVSRNGAQATSGDVTVNSGTGEVQVVTEVDFSIFFGGIAGRPTGTATALAAATCTPPSFANAPLPVAWSCHPPVLDDDEEDPEPDPGDPLPCTLDVWDYDLYGRDPDPNDPEESKYYYLVMDSIGGEDDLICVYPPNSMYDTECEGGICDEAEDYVEGYVDCDTDNDYDNDVFANGDRSWLDIDGGGGGTSELISYIKGEEEYAISIHTWLGGADGNKVNVYRAVQDYLIGAHAVIPVFDRTCPGDPETKCPELIHSIANGDEVDDTFAPGEGAGIQHFHIISFALFKITCVRVSPTKDDCPIYDQIKGHVEGLGHSTRSIEGYFMSGFVPDIGSLPIPGAETDLYIVKLTR